MAIAIAIAISSTLNPYIQSSSPGRGTLNNRNIEEKKSYPRVRNIYIEKKVRDKTYSHY